LFRFEAVGKLSGGHQAAIMVLGVDQIEDKDVVITGSKDHYIKVSTLLIYSNMNITYYMLSKAITYKSHIFSRVTNRDMKDIQI